MTGTFTPDYNSPEMEWPKLSTATFGEIVYHYYLIGDKADAMEINEFVRASHEHVRDTSRSTCCVPSAAILRIATAEEKD